MREILKLVVGIKNEMLFSRLEVKDAEIETLLQTIGVLDNVKQQQLKKLNSLISIEQDKKVEEEK